MAHSLDSALLIGDLSLSSTMHPHHQPVQGLTIVDSTLLPRLEYTVLCAVAHDLKEAVDPKWVTSVLDIKRIVNPEAESYQFLMSSGFDILVRDSRILLLSVQGFMLAWQQRPCLQGMSGLSRIKLTTSNTICSTSSGCKISLFDSTSLEAGTEEEAVI